MDMSKVLDTIDTGILTFDREYKVRYWNGWMTSHSCFGPNEIIGRSLFDFYPNLKNNRFLRNCQSVLTFGNLAFFPFDPYAYLFPMKPTGLFKSEFKQMQQSCTIGPLRDEKNEIVSLYVSVRDMTEAASQQEKLIQLTQLDPLTGAYNRRSLTFFIKEELYRFKRYHRPFSVVMIDIDHFKNINDQHGHLFGDEVLKSVSLSMQNNMRKLNRLARYGGEEFCCILPETDLKGASALAEKFRNLIAGLTFTSKEGPVSITASFGVATVEEDMDSVEAVLKKPDDALYRAKTSGRNKMVIAA